MKKKKNIKVNQQIGSLTEMMDGVGNMVAMLSHLEGDAEKYFALGVLSAMTAKNESRKEAG